MDLIKHDQRAQSALDQLELSLAVHFVTTCVVVYIGNPTAGSREALTLEALTYVVYGLVGYALWLLLFLARKAMHGLLRSSW
jgi:hypothetical protein